MLSIILTSRAFLRANQLSPRIIASSHSAASTASTNTETSKDSNSKKKAMPITVLSGFLGAGKTSFLTYAINNNNGENYGLVVNDMAAVNVDSKLIKQQTQSTAFDGIDTMELSNGCVCCTLADDMMASVSKLVSLAETKNAAYDHIIVECSGIAEPRNIRDLFQELEDYGLNLFEKIRLDTLVTLVDATVFMDYFGTNENLNSAEELVFRPTDDSPDREMVGTRKVTELLLEQVECADVVLINKIDLLEDQARALPLIKRVIASVNPTAHVEICERGVISPNTVLGVAGGTGAADWGILDEHRKVVAAVKAKAAAECNDPQCDDPSHDHSASATTDCSDSTCNDPTHNHNHDHSHGHSHDDDTVASDCSDPTCTDPSHNHDHQASSAAECTDSTCNDPTHNHDHAHSHSHSDETEEQTTARERFGITSFVYTRRRPFHPERMSAFLQSLGKLSIEGLDDITGKIENKISDSVIKSAAKSLMRSKGFVWIATSKAAAYFMSHAGQYLELVVLGRWWADIPEDEWPANSAEEIRVDWDESIPKHGDRRQELVFIGQFDSNDDKKALEKVLDGCLLTDAEMEIYEAVADQGDEALRKVYFPDGQQ